MRLSDFFNLSILEVEEYIKSCTTFDSMFNSSDLAKCLSLTGFNNYVFGRSGRIRVAKKTNPHKIYFTHMLCSSEIYGGNKYWISFNMPRGSWFMCSFLIGISPETLDITYIKYGGETYQDLDKTKRLKEFLYEPY